MGLRFVSINIQHIGNGLKGEETDSNGQDNFPGGPVGVKQEVDIRHGEHEILENK